MTIITFSTLMGVYRETSRDKGEYGVCDPRHHLTAIGSLAEWHRGLNVNGVSATDKRNGAQEVRDDKQDPLVREREGRVREARH